MKIRPGKWPRHVDKGAAFNPGLLMYSTKPRSPAHRVPPLRKCRDRRRAFQSTLEPLVRPSSRSRDRCLRSGRSTTARLAERIAVSLYGRHAAGNGGERHGVSSTSADRPRFPQHRRVDGGLAGARFGLLGVLPDEWLTGHGILQRAFHLPPAPWAVTESRWTGGNLRRISRSTRRQIAHPLLPRAWATPISGWSAPNFEGHREKGKSRFLLF